MKMPSLLSVALLSTVGFGTTFFPQDPITDMADFYYAGENNELACEALLTACQKIPNFTEVGLFEPFDATLKVVTNARHKFLLMPKMGRNGLDRLVIVQWFNAADALSDEAASVFCNQLNNANTYMAFSFKKDRIIESRSCITFENILKAEHLEQSLKMHRAVMELALNKAYPEESWKALIR